MGLFDKPTKAQRKARSASTNFVVYWTLFAVEIGYFWLMVWIFHPPISSNVVWWLAFLWASIDMQLTKIKWEVDG